MNRPSLPFIPFLFLLVAGTLLTGALLALLLGYSGIKIAVLALLSGLLGSMGMLIDQFRQGKKLETWLLTEQGDLPQRGMMGQISRRLSLVLRSRQRQLQQQQDQHNNLLIALNAAPLGILLLDARQQILWGNRQIADFLGFIFPRDYQQQITNLLRQPEFIQLINQTEKQPGHLVLTVPKQNHTIANYRLQLIPYSFGQYQIMLVEDITEQERLKKVQQDFVANVSHEIRTPLTVLSGFVETLQNLTLTEQQRQHYLGYMAQQSERIHQLVNDLLLLARNDRQPIPPLTQWFELDLLFKQIMPVAAQLSVHQQWQFIYPQSQIEITGDLSALLSALSNLVSNASKYSAKEGTITVRWYENEQQQGVLAVEDHGAGIAREHLARLTERFYRVDGGRSSQTGGAGLGLAIVKQIMDNHGGDLSISSQVGKGSCFSLILPAFRIRKRQ